MFIEVNNLKGLIVDLESFDEELDPYWGEIIDTINCVFVYKDDSRRISFEHTLRSSITLDSVYFVKKRHSIFITSTIKKAVKTLGLELYEVAYVTSSYREKNLILDEPIGTILINPRDITYEDVGKMPDFIIQNISSLKEIINGGIKGYFSEVCTTNVGNYRRIEYLSYSGICFDFILEFNGFISKVISGGRYFAPKHAKQQVHQLSRRILRNKDVETQEDLFYSIFEPLIGLANNEMKVDAVTRVPPRPNGSRDRFQAIVEKICLQNGYQNLCSSLVCIEDYPTQKGLSRDERIENVRGKFYASDEVKGKHIVIIDDVLTTGATIMECASTMYKKGASKVTIVVLAVNQFDNPWRSKKPLSCDNTECDGVMKLRFANNDKNMFFGCSKYNKGCRNSYSFIEGWHKVNKLNTIEDYYQEDEEEDSF